MAPPLGLNPVLVGLLCTTLAFSFYNLQMLHNTRLELHAASERADGLDTQHGKLLEELKASNKALTAKVESLEAQLADQKTKLDKGVAGQQASTSEAMGKIQAEMRQYHDSLTALESKQKALEGQGANLSSQSEVTLKALNARVEELQKELQSSKKSMSAQLASLVGSQISMQAHVDTIKQVPAVTQQTAFPGQNPVVNQTTTPATTPATTTSTTTSQAAASSTTPAGTTAAGATLAPPAINTTSSVSALQQVQSLAAGQVTAGAHAGNTNTATKTTSTGAVTGTDDDDDGNHINVEAVEAATLEAMGHGPATKVGPAVNTAQARPGQPASAQTLGRKGGVATATA